MGPKGNSTDRRRANNVSGILIGLLNPSPDCGNTPPPQPEARMTTISEISATVRVNAAPIAKARNFLPTRSSPLPISVSRSEVVLRLRRVPTGLDRWTTGRCDPPGTVSGCDTISGLAMRLRYW